MVHLWFHRVLERIVSRGYDLQPLSALLKAFAEGPDDAHVRPLRNEAELGDMLMDFDRGALEELCAEGLIVRIARPGVPLAWRLAHHALLSTVNALP